MLDAICLRPVRDDDPGAKPEVIPGSGRIPGIASEGGGVRFSDAVAWMIAMHEMDLVYHWDDDPADIEMSVGLKQVKLFTADEARAVAEIVGLVREAGVDPCAVSVEWSKYGAFKIGV